MPTLAVNTEKRPTSAHTRLPAVLREHSRLVDVLFRRRERLPPAPGGRAAGQLERVRVSATRGRLFGLVIIYISYFLYFIITHFFKLFVIYLLLVNRHHFPREGI